MLFHHKFTPAIAQKVLKQNRWSIVERWNIGKLKTQTGRGKKKGKNRSLKFPKQKQQEGENLTGQKSQSVIPAQEHRRYWSKTCARGAAQELNRRKVKTSFVISLTKYRFLKSWLVHKINKSNYAEKEKFIKNQNELL